MADDPYYRSPRDWCWFGGHDASTDRTALYVLVQQGDKRPVALCAGHVGGLLLSLALRPPSPEHAYKIRLYQKVS